MPPVWAFEVHDVRALASNLMKSQCHFILGTNSTPFCGGEYAVYALQTASGTRIAIRIPKDHGPHAPLLLGQEAGIRQRIDSIGLPLFPSLISFDDTTDNLISAPFLALDWVDGHSLVWSDTQPAAKSERESVLRTAANATIDLLRINNTGMLLIHIY